MTIRALTPLACSLVLVACASGPPELTPDADAEPPEPPESQTEPPEPQPEPPELEVLAPFVGGVHGMALADDGTLYYADSFGNAPGADQRYIYALASPYDGEPVATPITGQTPAGLAWDAGSLLVCDLGANTITRYDASFEVIESWTVPTPWNLARGPQGQWFAVTFDGRVVELGADGQVSERFAGLDAPFDLVVVEEGVWVSEQGQVTGDPGGLSLRRFSGELVRAIEGEWPNPEGLAQTADGSVWVAETERGELVRVDPEGEVEVWAEGLELPVVVALAPDGALFVSTGGAAPELLRLAPVDNPSQ